MTHRCACHRVTDLLTQKVIESALDGFTFHGYAACIKNGKVLATRQRWLVEPPTEVNDTHY